MIFQNIFRCFFFIILVTTAAPQFFCTLTSLNSISEPNNQLCLLGEIDKFYKAWMYVCRFVHKSKCQLQQPVQFFVFFFLKYKIELVNMVLRILNLEGCQNICVVEKLRQFYHCFFSKKI